MKQKIKIAKELKELMKAEQFVVTGSVALAYQGLIDPEKCHDVDILVYNPCGAGLAYLMENGTGINYGDEEEDQLFIFKRDGVEVNIWVFMQPISVREFTQSASGLHYSTVMRILMAKSHFGRDKDYKQIMAVAERILSIVRN